MTEKVRHHFIIARGVAEPIENGFRFWPQTEHWAFVTDAWIYVEHAPSFEGLCEVSLSIDLALKDPWTVETVKTTDGTRSGTVICSGSDWRMRWVQVERKTSFERLVDDESV